MATHLGWREQLYNTVDSSCSGSLIETSFEHLMQHDAGCLCDLRLEFDACSTQCMRLTSSRWTQESSTSSQRQSAGYSLTTGMKSFLRHN